MKAPRHAGFTLVELLVVMVLIALLVSLTAYGFRRMFERAHVTKCLSNLRQLGASLHAYLGEHEATMPELEIARASLAEKVAVIDTALAPYAPDHRVFACPSDTAKNFAERTGTSYLWNKMLNLQRLSNLNFLKLSDNYGYIPVIADKEKFHPYLESGINVLYADGHVSEEVKFRDKR